MTGCPRRVLTWSCSAGTADLVVLTWHVCRWCWSSPPSSGMTLWTTLEPRESPQVRRSHRAHTMQQAAALLRRYCTCPLRLDSGSSRLCGLLNSPTHPALLTPCSCLQRRPAGGASCFGTSTVSQAQTPWRHWCQVGRGWRLLLAGVLPVADLLILAWSEPLLARHLTVRTHAHACPCTHAHACLWMCRRGGSGGRGPACRGAARCGAGGAAAGAPRGGGAAAHRFYRHQLGIRRAQPLAWVPCWGETAYTACSLATLPGNLLPDIAGWCP